MPALKIKYRNADATESKNVYVVYGSKAFAIGASDIRNASFYRLYQ